MKLTKEMIKEIENSDGYIIILDNEKQIKSAIKGIKPFEAVSILEYIKYTIIKQVESEKANPCA